MRASRGTPPKISVIPEHQLWPDEGSDEDPEYVPEDEDTDDDDESAGEEEEDSDGSNASSESCLEEIEPLDFPEQTP